MSAETVVWSAATLLAYTYAGYPALLWVWSVCRRRPLRLRPHTPAVTVVVVAHNEADSIGAKLDELLALDYPPQRLKLIVACDGSTDNTARIVRQRCNSRVRLVEFRVRRGRAAVLNEVVPTASGEIVMLVDARQRIEPTAVRALVPHFADPAVAAVGGELVLADHGGTTYRRYESFLRRHESLVDSTVGVSGAPYALRRALFEPVPDATMLDDVLIPMRLARRGYRVQFEPFARAYGRAAMTADGEFRRKVRVLAGSFQMFAREPWLLSPWHNRLWLQTVSHKALRLLAPPALAALLGASVVLAREPVYGAALTAQMLFYIAAALGFWRRRRAHTSTVLSAPYAFCLQHWATVVGLCQWLLYRQDSAWQADKAR